METWLVHSLIPMLAGAATGFAIFAAGYWTWSLLARRRQRIRAFINHDDHRGHIVRLRPSGAIDRALVPYSPGRGPLTAQEAAQLRIRGFTADEIYSTGILIAKLNRPGGSFRARVANEFRKARAGE